MKLQIISRLSKRDSCPLDLPRRIGQSNQFINTQCTEIGDNINQYYSVHTENTANHPQAQPDNNFRDFFNNFSANCSVNYKAADLLAKDVKRKLEPILQSIKNKRSYVDLQTNKLVKEIRQKIATNIRPCSVEQSKPSHLELDPKQTYYFQKVHKIKKVSSLISLDNQQNRTLNSNRKPGFIRMNKSINKKQSSLSNLVQIPTQPSCDSSKIVNTTVASSLSGSKVQAQINESKERIAKIRRELNEIYNMRKVGVGPRLRLAR